MLLVSRTPTRWQRSLDVLLGVRRRRRHLAYVAIVGGLRALRPMLWRTGAVAAVLLLAVRIT